MAPDRIGVADEWEEVVDHEPDLGYHFGVECSNICYLAREVEHGAAFRLFRRRDG